MRLVIQEAFQERTVSSCKAVQVCCVVHPFTTDPYEPGRCLMLRTGIYTARSHHWLQHPCTRSVCTTQKLGYRPEQGLARADTAVESHQFNGRYFRPTWFGN